MEFSYPFLRRLSPHLHSHIFYQLCDGLSSPLREELLVDKAERFLFLKNSQCSSIEGVSDATQFSRTVEVMMDTYERWLFDSDWIYIHCKLL